ncbi:MAG: hypothetical protein HC819_19945 [Cyclobacteriaceae bacterium]|nr:hypothetical protein [Cyclobacteriaceae bacterium]
MNLQKAILFIFLVSVHGVYGQGLEISRLKIDHQNTPLGFDNHEPEFSWMLNASERGAMQSAYEIVVSEDEARLEKGSSWHSGKVPGSQTFGVRYAGRPLKSFTRYYWKVRAWNQEGNPSEWSDPSWFETSMMSPSDWKAQWISDQNSLPEKDEDFYIPTPGPLLRKEISLKKEVKKARLYIAGLGYSIAYINGQRVGDHMLDMPWTQFDKQVTYNTFDVTSMLVRGDNALGVMLGNGWYNPMPIKLFQRWNLRDYLTVGKPCLMAQLRITFVDGSTQTIVSDTSWKAGKGPILMNSVYLGETYDARLEQKGWQNPGYNDKHWQQVQTPVGPKGVLIARYIPPVRVTKILKPVKMTQRRRAFIFVILGKTLQAYRD